MFCDARGLPMTECGITDPATAMLVVVEVLCDPL